MKFSYPLIKKLVPAVNPVRNRGRLRLRPISNGVKSKKDLIEKLNLHSFEAEDLSGDVFDVSLPPNRYSDAASHFGIAKEISAIYGRNFQFPISNFQFPKTLKKAPLKVEIKDKNICSRYAAQYFENVKVGPSPAWIKKVLIDCGLRPINNVVDATNYAMLLTGQPLHVFDYDKLEGKTIIVRRAKKGEKITTLDDKKYDLDEKILVIADKSRPLAIAGVKGGKLAEIGKKTERIVVEAANFNSTNIYKSTKILKLDTDASLRFARDLSPELVGLGLNQVADLLKKTASAKTGQIIDVNFAKTAKKIIGFDILKFNQFIGVELDFKKIRNYLENLGCKIRVPGQSYPVTRFLAEISPVRRDLETFEDLTEEVIRLYGYNRIKSAAPRIHLMPSGFEDEIVLKDKIRKVLTGSGFSEVYNYSFISENDGKKFGFKNELIELQNPISKEFQYLRPSLIVGLLRNIEHNLKFFGDARIFEIGRIFFKESGKKTGEKNVLSVAIAHKSNKESFFELKGFAGKLFKQIGLVDYLMAESSCAKKDWVCDFTKEYIEKEAVLSIESGNSTFGYLGRLKNSFSNKATISLFEIDLDVLLKLVVEEHEYRPLSKFPSVMRDISISVSEPGRIGDIIQEIQEANTKYIEDVDLIDEYRGNFAFRIVFQAENKTLTDAEVNKEMKKIEKILQVKFRAKIR